MLFLTKNSQFASSLFSLPSSLTSSLLPLSHLYSFFLLLSWDLAPSLPSLSPSPSFLLFPSSSLSCSHGTQRPPFPLSLHLPSFFSFFLPLSLAPMGPSALPALSLFISTLSPPSFFLSLLLSWDLAPSLSSCSSSSLLLFLLSPFLVQYTLLHLLSHFLMRPSTLSAEKMQQKKSLLYIYLCAYLNIFRSIQCKI